MKRGILSFLLVLLVLHSCGGGGGGDTTTPQPTQSQTLIGVEGGVVTLVGGETLTIAPNSLTTPTTIDFDKHDLSSSVGEEVQSYIFASDKAIQQATFAIPIAFGDIQSVQDLHAVYIHEEGAMKIPTLEYNASSQIATVRLNDNWTFPTVAHSRSLVRNTTLSPNYLIIMKSKQSSLTPKSGTKLIEMPFYEQPGSTCWATTAKMLTHGLPNISGAMNDTDTIYGLMSALQIGIDDGFNGFYRGASLAKVIGTNHSNYFLWSSVQKKLIEELDNGNPLIYMGTFQSLSDPKSKIAHAVLIVGYEYGSSGELSFIMHDPRNVGSRKMYTSMPWSDMQLVQYAPTEAVTLFWSSTPASTLNSTITMGIPTHGELGSFYFEGAKKDALNSVRYHLQFSTQESKGYIWSQDLRLHYPQTLFQKNVSQLVLDLPLYNSGTVEANAFITVEVYEKNQPSNKVSTDLDKMLLPLTQTTVAMQLDLTPLIEKLQNPSECVVSISLNEEGKRSTWHIFDGFSLTPMDDVVAPVATPVSGTQFSDTLEVTLNNPQDLAILYTLNGGDTQLYTAPILLNETTKIEAVASKDIYSSDDASFSSVATFEYIKQEPNLGKWVLSSSRTANTCETNIPYQCTADTLTSQGSMWETYSCTYSGGTVIGGSATATYTPPPDELIVGKTYQLDAKISVESGEAKGWDIAIIADYESSSQRTTLYNATGDTVVTTNPLVPINNENYKTLMIQYIFRGLCPIYYEYTYTWEAPASL